MLQLTRTLSLQSIFVFYERYWKLWVLHLVVRKPRNLPPNFMKISGFDNLGGVVRNQLIMFLWVFFHEKALYIHVVMLQFTAFPLNWITSCKHLYIGIYINCLKHFFLYFQQNLSASIISINISPISQEIHLSLFFLPVTFFIYTCTLYL